MTPMANRMQPVPSISMAKKPKIDGYQEGEGIERLPDHILVSIISLLTMNESVRSSILSRRWRYLWTCNLRLNFDSGSILEELRPEKRKTRELNVERRAYANWVNQVLASYGAQTIELFRIRFDLDLGWANDIDSWVNFAMKRKVNMFELNLISYYASPQKEPYVFPTLEDYNCYSSLSVLKLGGLNLTGDVLESFLCNCPCLEILYVLSSQSLVDLSVRGLSLKLKHLEISLCYHVGSLQISAPNLLSFKYGGPIINMPLENTPKLVDLSLKCIYGMQMKFDMFQFSHYCSRLQKLTLDVEPDNASRVNIHGVQFPNFNNLKELILMTIVKGEDTIFGFTSLLKNSPMLEKFSLEVCYCKYYVKRPLLEIEKWPLENIKEVEITGFVGRPVDLEFILFITSNAVALEKLILETKACDYHGILYICTSNKKNKARKRRARRLQKSLPKIPKIIIP